MENDYSPDPGYQEIDYQSLESLAFLDAMLEPVSTVYISTTPCYVEAVEVLNLSDQTAAIAASLLTEFPHVTFTSGRRSVSAQARAMATNVAQNRQWIVQTYRASNLRTALQAWVDANPTKITIADIQAGLMSVFENASAEDVSNFSKHLGGDAFDVTPYTGGDSVQVKEYLRARGMFLDEEGGLVRWHFQRR